MKNKKLELLLNKVVEYNHPKGYDGNGCHFKAFLYKNSNRKYYYFKVVEIIAGTNIAFNDIIQLKDGDEKFLIVADKPKLMRISKKSWHYRLLKYVLRDNVPTPQDMQNGCPYAWLLVFSMLVVPFIVLFKVVRWAILLIPKALFWVLEEMVNSWIAGLDDEDAYNMYWDDGRGGGSKMPKTAKIFFNNSENGFFDFFLSKKYKDLSIDDPNYDAKREEIKAKWKVWREDLDEKRTAQRKETQEKNAKRDALKREHDRKRKESKERWDVKMQPMRDWITNTSIWFRKTFTVERGRRNMIVKRTKQFVGAVVTLVILTATFFVVNYVSLGLMVATDWCIANWQIFACLVILAVVVGILYLLYVLITSWGQAVVNKYNHGKKVWYIEPLIYLVWYPVKYAAIAIAFLAVYIIWTPIRFILYFLLFKWFAKPVGLFIGLFIGRVFVNLCKGLVGSTGIFGEYFGASYSDYCPGLEWVDFDEDNE